MSRIIRQSNLISLCLVLLVLFGSVDLVGAAQAAPTLTISPTAGPAGTSISVQASGLEPMTRYLLQLVSGRDNVNTVRLEEMTVTTNAGGTFSGNLTVRHAPGAYTVRLVTIGGTVVATASLTITSPASNAPPGLPRTGAGIRASTISDASSGVLFGSLLTALLLLLLGILPWLKAR